MHQQDFFAAPQLVYSSGEVVNVGDSVTVAGYHGQWKVFALTHEQGQECFDVALTLQGAHGRLLDVPLGFIRNVSLIDQAIHAREATAKDADSFASDEGTDSHPAGPGPGPKISVTGQLDGGTLPRNTTSPGDGDRPAVRRGTKKRGDRRALGQEESKLTLPLVYQTGEPVKVGDRVKIPDEYKIRMVLWVGLSGDAGPPLVELALYDLRGRPHDARDFPLEGVAFLGRGEPGDKIPPSILHKPRRIDGRAARPAGTKQSGFEADPGPVKTAKTPNEPSSRATETKGETWIEKRYIKRGEKDYGPYLYKRWRDGAGHKRSKYLGKGTKVTGQSAENCPVTKSGDQFEGIADHIIANLDIPQE